ncbi:hypothetical protein [Anaerovibrio sp. RM50]|uniref:hypothetical protein n=1 Tax=Anaerovibrio sp. RM50 TaxID=1200557 RepID=UPI000489D222|nr:hypothetical protein [Anaerovibrio sp. RM50]
MSGKATKAANSVWYKARMRMAEKDSRFCSREITSMLVGIERTRIAQIELQNVIPHPDECISMAEQYKAPELLNYCCTRCCPIGMLDVEPVEGIDIDRITVKFLNATADIADIERAILRIASDGKVSVDEIPKMNEILAKLKELSRIKNEIAVYMRKLV